MFFTVCGAAPGAVRAEATVRAKAPERKSLLSIEDSFSDWMMQATALDGGGALLADADRLASAERKEPLDAPYMASRGCYLACDKPKRIRVCRHLLPHGDFQTVKVRSYVTARAITVDLELRIDRRTPTVVCRCGHRRVERNLNAIEPYGMIGDITGTIPGKAELHVMPFVLGPLLRIAACAVRLYPFHSGAAHRSSVGSV